MHGRKPDSICYTPPSAHAWPKGPQITHDALARYALPHFNPTFCRSSFSRIMRPVLMIVSKKSEYKTREACLLEFYYDYSNKDNHYFMSNALFSYNSQLNCFKVINLQFKEQCYSQSTLRG